MVSSFCVIVNSTRTDWFFAPACSNALMIASVTRIFASPAFSSSMPSCFASRPSPSIATSSISGILGSVIFSVTASSTKFLRDWVQIGIIPSLPPRLTFILYCHECDIIFLYCSAHPGLRLFNEAADNLVGRPFASVAERFLDPRIVKHLLPAVLLFRQPVTQQKQYITIVQLHILQDVRKFLHRAKRHALQQNLLHGMTFFAEN